MKNSSVALVLIVLNIARVTFAYSVPTHEAITKKAIGISNIRSTISDNLAINLADFDSFYKLQILKGSKFEDGETIFKSDRSLNHFHNPITNRGLTDPIQAGNQSAVTWAISDPENTWSWSEARNYFNEALGSPTAVERRDSYGKMFRALGQVVHLVQDASVPEHVRNDQHLISSVPFLGAFAYEPWLLGHVNPLDYSATAFSFPPNFPIRNFWDADTYIDSPFQQGPFTGLAEYTSYNFFSEDAIFTGRYLTTDKHYFPHPRKEFTNAMLKEEIAEDSQKDQVYYVHGYQANLLATYSYMDIYIPPLVIAEGWRYNRDANVFQEYAGRLIPMAISYSAGLLNYFFRGQIEVELASGGLKVKNVSSEAMGPGFIVIYYDDAESNRNYLAYLDVSSSINPGEVTQLIPFTRPANNIKPGRYIVVFQGQLGAEEGAVIGKITPPQKIYYVSKRSGVYKIYSMDTDGTNQTVVYDNLNAGLTISKLAPSPDGKTLAFTVDGPHIFLLDLLTGGLTEFTQGDWPDWSPDGKTIAFERDATPSEAFVQGGQLFSVIEIFSKNILTGNEVQLTHTYPPIGNTTAGSFNGHPAFSPDGQSIAYTRWPPDEADCSNQTGIVIYMMDASGNSNQALTCEPQNPWLDSAATWSPNGKEIAFLRRWTEPYNRLFKVSVDTKTITPLTDSDGTDYSELTPAWSTDGKFVAVGSNRDGDFDIWLVNPNGAGYLSNLTNSNSDIDGFPAYLK